MTITTTGLFTSQTATWLLHDFDAGAGVDIGQHITIGGSSTATASLVMQWDQPFFSVTGSVGATSDLAFFIWYDDNLNNSVDAGEVFDLNNTGTQIGGDPVESFSDFQEDGQLMIGVKVRARSQRPLCPATSSTSPSATTVNQLEWATASGTDYGHANAAGAISVGAADWFNTALGRPDDPRRALLLARQRADLGRRRPATASPGADLSRQDRIRLGRRRQHHLLRLRRL